MLGMFANRFTVVPFHSIRSSGTHRLLPSGRLRDRRPALSRFEPKGAEQTGVQPTSPKILVQVDDDKGGAGNSLREAIN
jgi:hypothetical protein